MILMSLAKNYVKRLHAIKLTQIYTCYFISSFFAFGLNTTKEKKTNRKLMLNTQFLDVTNKALSLPIN